MTPQTDEQKIKECIDKFMIAYNAGDIEEVLHCMDSKTQTKYKSALNLTNSLLGKTGLGVNMSDMFSFAANILSEEDFSEISDLDINIISNNDAEAYTVLSFNDNLSNGEMSEEVCFVMKKEGSDWFIHDIT